MTKIIIIRHAEAVGNADHIFQGWTDGGITRRGERQALALTKRLKELKPDAVYCSPLLRTRQTVQPFLAESGLSASIVEGLKEINGGDFEGVSFSDLPTLFPDAFELWENQPHLAHLPNGESMQQFELRVRRTLQEILDRHADQTVMIITHGAVMRVLTNWFLGFELDQIHRIPWCDNTTVMRATHHEGKCQLECAPDADHLYDFDDTRPTQEWLSYLETKNYLNIAEWLKENSHE